MGLQREIILLAHAVRGAFLEERVSSWAFKMLAYRTFKFEKNLIRQYLLHMLFKILIFLLKCCWFTVLVSVV